MVALLPFLLATGVIAAVMGCLARVAVAARRRGATGSALRAALAAHDEAFRITAHDSHQEIVAQAERTAPVWSPDGRGRPVPDAPAGPVAPRRPARSRPGRLRRTLRRLTTRPPRAR